MTVTLPTPPPPTHPCPPPPDRQDGCGTFLMTAAGPEDCALPGIMLGRVLEACQGLGLRVELGTPLASERRFWLEAFVTNW